MSVGSTVAESGILRTVADRLTLPIKPLTQKIAAGDAPLVATVGSRSYHLRTMTAPLVAATTAGAAFVGYQDLKSEHDHGSTTWTERGATLAAAAGVAVSLKLAHRVPDGMFALNPKLIGEAKKNNIGYGFTAGAIFDKDGVVGGKTAQGHVGDCFDVTTIDALSGTKPWVLTDDPHAKLPSTVGELNGAMPKKLQSVMHIDTSSAPAGTTLEDASQKYQFPVTYTFPGRKPFTMTMQLPLQELVHQRIASDPGYPGQGEHPLYTALLEKGLGGLTKNGYAKLDQGGNPYQAYSTFTGDEVRSIPVPTGPPGSTPKLDSIVKALDEGKTVTLGSKFFPGGDDSPEAKALYDKWHVYGSHAYAAGDVVRDADGKVKGIQPRNPWGKDHPKLMTEDGLNEAYSSVAIGAEHYDYDEKLSPAVMAKLYVKQYWKPAAKLAGAAAAYEGGMYGLRNYDVDPAAAVHKREPTPR